MSYTVNYNENDVVEIVNKNKLYISFKIIFSNKFVTNLYKNHDLSPSLKMEIF